MRADLEEESVFGRLSWPGWLPAGDDDSEGATVRGVAVAAWLLVNAVQIVVWGLICVIGTQFVFPWWVWTAVGGAVVVAGCGGSPGAVPRRSPGTSDEWDVSAGAARIGRPDLRPAATTR
jgi:hypothetical protein